MEVKITEQGLNALRKTLDDLPDEVEAKVVQAGSLEAARLAARYAKAEAPFKDRTGRLRASIRAARGIVRPDGGGRTKGAKLKAGGRDIVYARIVEFRGGGKFAYIRPALRKHLPEQMTAFGKGIGDAIIRATNSARRKAGK